MKTTKRTFKMTALTLLLCVCMVFGLAGCGASQEDIDNAVNEATAPLNEQIAQLNEDIADKEAEITTLEGEKATLVAEKTELEADVAALETEKVALMSAKAELEADVATLETEKSTLSTRVTELETQVQTLTNKVAELESSGSDNDSVIAQLRADIVTLQSEKSTLSSRVTELEGMIASKNSEIATLNSSIATLEGEKTTLSARITTLEASITEKDAEIANLTSTISTLRTEKETLTNKVAELESENTELKDKVEALENCIKGKHVADTYAKTETTHTYTCTVCGTEVTEEHEYVEGACVCGAEISDISATTLTAEELKNVVAEVLNTGITELQITLAANASAEMFTAIREALVEADIADGSVDLTLAGVTAIPDNSTSYPLFGMFEDPELTRCEAVAELRSISLPDAVTIGDYAFHYCENLTSLYAPKVQIVHEGAFAMTGLVTVELPEATTLEYKAFMECKALTSIKLPKVTTVGGLALDVVDPDTEVTIYLTADSDITIDEKCFWWVDNELLDEEVNLVLHTSKQSQVSGNTWTTKDQDGNDVSFTFKSISFVS